MTKEQERKFRNQEMDKEVDALLMAISGTMQRIAGNIQLLCAKRRMKGAGYYDNR